MIPFGEALPSESVPVPVLPGLTWLSYRASARGCDLHVYLDDTTRGYVAVTTSSVDASDEQREAVEHEAQMLGAMSQIPGIVHLHGTRVCADGRLCVLTDFYPGGDLGSCLSGEPMPLGEALPCVLSVANTLHALHQQGLTHLSVQPQSVFLDSLGQPVLGSVGRAAVVGTARSGGIQADQAMWVAPEASTLSGLADPRTDVWGLGALMWTLLSGVNPFLAEDGDNSALSVASRVRQGLVASALPAGVPSSVEGVLRSALNPQPVQRWASAADFANALAQAVEQWRASENLPSAGGQDSVEVEACVSSGGDGESRSSLPVGAAIVLGVMLGVIVVVLGFSWLTGQSRWQFSDSGSVHEYEDVQVENPVGVPPAAPSDIEYKVRDGRVLWSWRYEVEESGQSGAVDSEVRFLYEISRPGQDPLIGTSALNSVDSPAVLGENCLTVVTRRMDGRTSEPLTTCVVIVE